MKALARLRHLFRGAAHRDRVERELDDELRLHVEMETEANLRRGLDPAEARRAARRRFGGMEQVKEDCRETWSVRFWEVLAQDVRYGLRGLRRSPGFTAAVVLTLGLGIGANTAVFSLINGVLLKPLPYARGDQVVVLRQPDARADLDDLGWSPLELRDYREMAQAFDGVVEYHSMDFTLLGGDQPSRVRAGVVSASFFDVLEIRPLLGRTFRAADEAPGAEAVLVLSHDYWRALGSDAGIVGRRFEMNDRPHVVVGVLPPIPEYPAHNDVYMPSTACPFRNRPAVIENRRARLLSAFARVKPGVTLPQAQAELDTVSGRLRTTHPDAFPPEADPRAVLSPLKEDLVRSARPTFLALLATVALVLLIACANVANLTLARLVERSHELAIRSALGAGRMRILRQLLTESTILAVAGGALGLLLAYSSRGLLAAFAARFTSRAAEVQIDGPVLLFTLGASLLTGLLAGTLPALPAREKIAPVLLSEIGRCTTDHRRQRMRSGLVVWQLALSFILLIGAALMLRSLDNLRRVDPGFAGDHLLTTGLHLNFSKYSTPEHRLDVDRVHAFYRAVYGQLLGTSGVVSIAHAWTFPLNNAFRNDGTFLVEGQGEAGARPKATFIGVSPDYFETLGVPRLRGRVFDDRDRAGSAAAVVVSQRLASRHWRDGDALGRRISIDNGRTWRTVEGVVGDVRQEGLDREPQETVYVPFLEFPGYAATLFVRTLGDPARAARQVASAARQADPQTALSNVRTFDQIRSEALSSPRLTTQLLGLFAVLALAITMAGLSGLIAYSVSRRTQEIGIRMALGADPPRIAAMVLREGLASVVLGLAVGAAGALALSRLVSGLLFGVGPTDLVCFVGSAIVLLSAAVVACLLPARRATAVSPMVALRSQA